MASLSNHEAGGTAGLPGHEVDDSDIRLTGTPSPKSTPSGERLAAWQRVWRNGLVPQLSTKGLLALKRALENDSPDLITGATTSPPPLQCVSEWPVQGCCPLSFTGWQGDGLETVGQVEEYFARVCWEADQRLGEPAACRYFLNAVDEWSREELLANLLPEVQRALAQRQAWELVTDGTETFRIESAMPAKARNAAL